MRFNARVVVTGVEERTSQRTGNKYWSIGLAGDGSEVLNVMSIDESMATLKRFGEYDAVFNYREGNNGGRLNLDSLTPVKG